MPNNLDDRIETIVALANSIDTDRYPTPLDQVQALRMLIETATSTLPLAVAAARESGESWDRIGRMLGTSRQAAWERFGPR